MPMAVLQYGMVKDKDILIQAWLPEFLDSQHKKVVRLSPVRIDRLYPQETPVVLTSVRG
jgi:hypothetical protein